MQESLLVLAGIIVGTVFTGSGCVLGAYLVKKTYIEVTQTYPVIVEVDEDNNKVDEPEGYDWSEYDSYLKPPLGDDGGDPEA